MKSILPTILIIGAGMLAGCSTPSAHIQADSHGSPSPWASGKVYVIQHPSLTKAYIDARKLAGNPITHAQALVEKAEPKLAARIEAELAAKGFQIVSPAEADCTVTFHLEIREEWNRDSHNPPTFEGTPDYQATLTINVEKRESSQAGQLKSYWTGALTTFNEDVDLISCVNPLVRYLGQNFDGETRISKRIAEVSSFNGKRKP